MVTGTSPAPPHSHLHTGEDYIIEALLVTHEAYAGRELDTTKDPNADYSDEPPPAPNETHHRRRIAHEKARKILGDGPWGIYEVRGGMKKLATFLEMQIIDPSPYQRHQYEMTMSCIPIFVQWCYGLPWTKLNLAEAMRQAECSHSCPVVTIIVRRQAGKTEWGVRFIASALASFPSDDISNPATYLLKAHIIGAAGGNLVRMQEWLLTKWKYISHLRPSNFAKNGNLISAGKIELTNIHDEKDIRRVVVPTSNIDGKTKVRMLGDEFMKWREDAATSQILPMLQAGATFILISALKNPAPWVQQWLNKADGKLVFLLNKAEVCMKCLNNLTFEHAHGCEHQRGVQAGFIDSEKLAETVKMMNPTAAMMELMSILPVSGGAIFTEKDLRAQLMRKHPGDLNKTTGKLDPPVFDNYVVYCDPSMGSAMGAGSETCVAIAGFREKPGMPGAHEIVLLSLSNQATPSTSEIVRFVVKCMRDFFETFHHKSPILQQSGRQKAYIYLSIEQQSVPHTKEIAEALSKFPKMAEHVIFIKSIVGKATRKNFESGIRGSGHWLELRGGQGKRANDESRYAGMTVQALRNGNWSVHPNMISSNLQRSGALALEAALGQFLHVHAEKPPGGKERIVSGKTVSGSATMNDIWITLSTMITNVFDLVTDGGRFHMIFNSGQDLLSNLRYYTNQIEVLPYDSEDGMDLSEF